MAGDSGGFGGWGEECGRYGALKNEVYSLTRKVDGAERDLGQARRMAMDSAKAGNILNSDMAEFPRTRGHLPSR